MSILWQPAPVSARSFWELVREAGGVGVGSVRTGFKERDAYMLRETLDKLRTETPPVEYAGRRKDIAWVRPTTSRGN